MLSQQRIKDIRNLHQKKFRQLNRAFLVEGDKMVRELLTDPGFLRLKALYALPVFLEDLPVDHLELETHAINPRELKQISSLQTPSKAVLVSEIPEFSVDTKMLTSGPSFFFQKIQDPGNLGTILRTSDWFGIRQIVCSPGSVDVFNPKVVQASMGSISRVHVLYEDAGEILKLTAESGISYLGTALKGDSIYTSNIPEKSIFFFGNESSGLDDDVLASCTKTIHIPSFSGEPGPESLNLGISVGIVGSEIRRRYPTQNES